MSEGLYDEDGIDGPFERRMRSAMREDAREDEKARKAAQAPADRDRDDGPPPLTAERRAECLAALGDDEEAGCVDAFEIGDFEGGRWITMTRAELRELLRAHEEQERLAAVVAERDRELSDAVGLLRLAQGVVYAAEVEHAKTSGYLPVGESWTEKAAQLIAAHDARRAPAPGAAKGGSE